MNERLKQLMQEAGYAAPEIASRANKLAELIVRECALIAGIMEHEDRKGIGAQILDSFGVDTDDEIEYCPRCNAQWSGTSCGLPYCGWVGEV